MCAGRRNKAFMVVRICFLSRLTSNCFEIYRLIGEIYVLLVNSSFAPFVEHLNDTDANENFSAFHDRCFVLASASHSRNCSEHKKIADLVPVANPQTIRATTVSQSMSLIMIIEYLHNRQMRSFEWLSNGSGQLAT